MKKIIWVIGVFLIIISCQKQKDKEIPNIFAETPCLNDSAINNIGRYELVGYKFNRISDTNYVKVYIDTFELIISKIDCNTLNLSEIKDIKFIFKDSNKSYGTYSGTNKCHCNYQLTLLDKKNIILFESCGGGGSPCSLGIVVRYYDGRRVE